MKPPFPAGTIENFFPKTPYFFLSNFYPSSVTYDGVTYLTVEHAYQAAKSLDLDVRKIIAACGSAAAAKQRGNSVVLRPGWDQLKFGLMAELIQQKFAVNTSLGNLLEDTGTVELIEGNYWHDLVWGQCFCGRHNWDGANRLGGILMEKRLQLRSLHESERSSASVGNH